MNYEKRYLFTCILVGEYSVFLFLWSLKHQKDNMQLIIDKDHTSCTSGCELSGYTYHTYDIYIFFFSHEKPLKIAVRVVDTMQFSHLININLNISSTLLVASIFCTFSSSRPRIERKLLTHREYRSFRTSFM